MRSSGRMGGSGCWRRSRIRTVPSECGSAYRVLWRSGGALLSCPPLLCLQSKMLAGSQRAATIGCTRPPRREAKLAESFWEDKPWRARPTWKGYLKLSLVSCRAEADQGEHEQAV